MKGTRSIIGVWAFIADEPMDTHFYKVIFQWVELNNFHTIVSTVEQSGFCFGTLATKKQQ